MRNWNKKNGCGMENSKELQRQYKEYREKVYGEYPEVERFWKNKKRVIGFLLIFCLVHNFAVSITATGGDTGMAVIFGTVIRIAPDLIFLLAAMGRGWKIDLCLYLLGLYRLIDCLQAIWEVGEMYSGGVLWIFGSIFENSVWMGIIAVCQFLYPVLILLAAVWLTLIPKNRELGAELERANEKLKEFMMNHSQKQ